MEDYYQKITILTRSVFIFILPTCIPDLDVVQYMNIHNFTLSMPNPENDPQKTLAVIWGSSSDNYIKIISNFTNYHLYDYNGASYPLAAGGAPTDEVYLDNILYENAVGAYTLSFMIKFGIMKWKNLTYRNSAGQQYALIHGLLVGDVTVENFYLQNVTGSLNPMASLVSFSDNAKSKHTFDGIYIQNTTFLNTKLFLHPSSIDLLTLNNFVITNSTILSGQSLISISNTFHAVVSNYSINGFTTSDTNNDETLLIRIGSINLQSDYDTELFEVRNASINIER